MDILYSIMLIIVGIILAVRFIKESKIFILPGIYFVFVGIWRIVNSQMEADLFAGIHKTVFNVVSILMLLIMFAFFMRRYWAESHAKKENPDQDIKVIDEGPSDNEQDHNEEA
ncbi:hypothetical protein [Scatolibacter rhodanostii]|uniref:hypothetical protein n=1 Tax=Scatolibacter rhodanostii TaxID=2014781 RepID=UPI000C06B830|nr:hypothetical protein [Scatolibacter rhodanostii]